MISKCTIIFSSRMLSILMLAGIQLTFPTLARAATTTCTDGNITLNNESAAIGSAISYTHTNLDSTKTVVIKFDGVASPAVIPIKISNYHELSATVPASIKKLQTVVDLEVDSKLVCSSTLKILPNITSVNPATSKIDERVTISGTGFDFSDINKNKVSFNGVSAELTGFSGTDILAVTPKSVTGQLQIETLSGKSNSPIVQTISTPFITGVNLNKAPTGNTIDISGGNFDNTSYVKINNVSAEILSVSPNTIKAKVPVATPITLVIEKGQEKSIYQVDSTAENSSSNDNKLGSGARRKLLTHTSGFYKKGDPSQYVAPAGSTLRVYSDEDNDGNITVFFTCVGKLERPTGKSSDGEIVVKDTKYFIKAKTLFDSPTKGYGFTSGILTVPYKYYPNQQELSGQPTVSGYLGYKFESIGYDLSLIGSGGLGVVPITTTNADGSKSNGSGASFAVAWGFIMTVNKYFQVGIVQGWDWTNKSSNYEFQGKPWIAVSLGTAIY